MCVLCFFLNKKILRDHSHADRAKTNLDDGNGLDLGLFEAALNLSESEGGHLLLFLFLVLFDLFVLVLF